MDAEPFAEWLGLRTKAAKQSLTSQLTQWNSSPEKLLQLSEKFKKFKKAFEVDPGFYGNCQILFDEISLMEAELQTLLNDQSDLEKESYGEILFMKSYFQPLNFIPMILTWWSLFRVYILPGLSLLLPVITLLAPYLILTYIFKIPITLSRYLNMLQVMISGQFQQMMDPTHVDGVDWSSIPLATLLKQFGIIVMTFAQGILQPYWTFKHLRSVDSIIYEKGQMILRFRDRYMALEKLLQDHGFTFFRCPLPDLLSERDATARIILQPAYFKLAMKYIGQLEVLVSMAAHNDLHPVRWVQSSSPVFRVMDTYDYQVPALQRKTISARFDKKRHALLTGPNKGGKSTVLRALSNSALLAHTYGCSFGSLTCTPFEKMFVCLKPDDLPGSKSRFEREIEFTASTLHPKGHILVFIDELYHSTNPPDALRSCEIYCDPLWKKPNVISVISTHLFDWVERADPSIQRLCCSAYHNEEGILHFQYELQAGVCKVSSVDMLLEKNGLAIGATESSLKKLPLTTEC